MRHRAVTVIGVLLCLATVAAAERDPLTRDEVALTKKKLLAVMAAMGPPPAGYVKEDESFDLPTQVVPYVTKKTPGASGTYRWLAPSASYRFGGASGQGKKSLEDTQKEMERKIAEAMAKGDLDQINKLADEMTRAAGQAHLEAMKTRKDPIEVRILLNASESQPIDPDAVLYEKPGAIALTLESKQPSRNRVAIYFDPVALKDSRTLSRIDLQQPEGGVSRKTAILNAVIVVSGPAADVKAWAQRIDAGAVLGQIDAPR